MPTTAASQTAIFLAKVCVFFAVNRDEEMTTSDLAVKFDMTPSNFRYRMDLLVKNRLLNKSTRGVRGTFPGRWESVYSAGPELQKLMPYEDLA